MKWLPFVNARTLGARFLIYILMLGFFFTLIETGVQLFMDYRGELAFIEKQIRQIQDSYLKSIVKSTWNMAADDVLTHLEGALQLRDIQYLEVRTEMGDILAVAGRIPEGASIEKTFPLEYRHFDRQARIGEIRVIASLEEVRRRIVDRGLIILSSRAVRTFFTSLFILGIFHYLVSRHLSAMARYADHMDLDHLDVPLTLNRSDVPTGRTDELARVVTAMNDMRTRILNEVTEKKQAEKNIRMLRNYLSNVIDSMPSVLIGVDADGIVTQWNRQAREITGIPSPEACGRRLESVFPRLENRLETIREAIRTRLPREAAKVHHLEEGLPVYENITIYPLTSNAVEGAVIRIDDVTEKIRIEEMMIQSEKMMSIGGLAAGMAHEINNPLAGIMGNAQILKQRLLDESETNIRLALTHTIRIRNLKDYLEERGIPRMLDNINESCVRAARIVRNMLSFSRKSEKQFKSNDLTVIMDDTIELACNDYHLKNAFDFKKIAIVREYERSLPPVFCEGIEIQQVFFNLLKNAAEAMAEASLFKEEPRITVRLRSDRGWVVIEIQDNGPGMEDALRKRIFEPFFTTKGIGSGTGLGLSVSYFIIVEQHGGTMEVVSNPGQGARFIIRLPVSGKK